MNRILVTGATGRVGRHLISQLMRPGVSIRAMARKPESAGLPPEVEVMPGDLTIPETLDQCLDGMDSVFLVWMAPPATVPAVIERIAKHARRVVFLSSPYQTDHPLFQGAQPNGLSIMQADIERRIREAGLEWTFVRPGMFSANALWWWAEQIRSGDVVRWPYGDTPTAPVDDRDIAAIAAHGLCDPGTTAGDYVVTGPESMTQREQVQTIGEVIGRPLRFEEITPEQWQSELPPDVNGFVGNLLLKAWAAALGHPALVTPTVSEITGKPPRSFRQWAEDNAAAFELRCESATMRG